MLNANPDAIFLSLRPRFAQAIVEGIKTAEVRRTRPRTGPGALALLYAASPVRKIVGITLIKDVVSASATQLWTEYGGQLALTRRELREYLCGAPGPTVLLLDDVQPLITPMPLSELRSLWNKFQPPQSYRFIPDADAKALVGRVRT